MLHKDKVICKDLSFQAQIGFHDYELGKSQEVKVSFEAEVPPMKKSEFDKAKDLKLDYYKANELIGELINGKKFNLLEALCEEIAQMLLKNFKIHSIAVTVKKFPKDMPNAASVSYSCRRSRKK